MRPLVQLDLLSRALRVNRLQQRPSRAPSRAHADGLAAAAEQAAADLPFTGRHRQRP